MKCMHNRRRTKQKKNETQHNVRIEFRMGERTRDLRILFMCVSAVDAIFVGDLLFVMCAIVAIIKLNILHYTCHTIRF